MPKIEKIKIKVKNIPSTVRKRICSDAECCSECPFDDPKDPYTKCMIGMGYDPKEKVIGLYEREFPTNREWLASMSNDKLANNLVTNPIFAENSTTIEKWLSQPCESLMEASTDAEN